MYDNNVIGTSFDSLIELLVALMFCAIGLVNFFTQVRNISLITEKYLNYDKVSVMETDEIDPFIMTAYQVYMLGYTIDNYGPREKSGVMFVDDSAGVLSIQISPETFHHSYTVRNRMISSKTSTSVAAILEKGAPAALSDHYRGFSNVWYKLTLCDEFVSEYSNIMSDNGLIVLEGDRKEYLWTVQEK